MASENLKIDQNTRWTLGGLTNDVAQEIKNLRVNPVTGRLIVEANVTSSNTSIGSTIPGGTDHAVLFLGVGGTLDEDPTNFYYDYTNHRLGLGTTSPSATLSVDGSVAFNLGGDATGDIFYRDAGGFITNLPIGSNNDVLTVSAGLPAWVPVSSLSPGYQTIENVGVAVTQRSIINLTNLLTATDVGGKTQLDINTANLANDNTFITTLVGNSTFITGIVNIVNNAGAAIQIDLATQVTGVLSPTNIDVTALAGDTTFINALEPNLDLANIGGDLDLASQVGTSILPLANGGTASNLTDPGANKLWGWDDTDNAIGFWTLGSGLSYDHATHTISSTGSGASINLTAGEDLTAGDTVGYASHIDDTAFKAVWAERLASADIGINNSAVQAVCRLTDDVYAILIVRVGGSNPYGTIIATLDRDTQTWSFGAPSASIGINSGFGAPDIVRLDVDKFAVAAFTSNTNPYTIEVVVCDVVGTNITVGNSDSFSEPSTDNANQVMCVQLDTDRFAMVVGGTQAGSHCDLFEVTVSGNTPTIGTQEILDNSTQRISAIEVIDTDKVAVVNDTNLWIATVSGGVWTVGSPATMSTTTGSTVGQLGIKSAATDTVYVATPSSNVTVEYFTVSGTVPTSVDTINSLSTSSTSMTLASDQTDVFLISQTVTAGENGASKLSILGGTTIISSPFIPFNISDNPGTNIMFANQVLEGSDYFGICQGDNNATGNLLEFIYHVQGMTPYFIGIVQGTAARGASVNVLIAGVDSNQTGLTPGALYNAFEGGIVNTATQTFDTLKAQSATDIKV